MKGRYHYDVLPVRLYLQADPVGVNQTPWPYSYAGNEPTAQSDSLGLLSVRARRFGTGLTGTGCDWYVSFNFLTREEVSGDALALFLKLISGGVPWSVLKLPKYRHLADVVVMVATDEELLRRLGSTEFREEGFEDWYPESGSHVKTLTATASALSEPLMTYDIPQMIEDAKSQARGKWWKDPWGHLCCD